VHNTCSFNEQLGLMKNKKWFSSLLLFAMAFFACDTKTMLLSIKPSRAIVREEANERSIVKQLGLASSQESNLWTYSLKVKEGCAHSIPLWKLSLMKKLRHLQVEQGSQESPIDASMVTSQQLNLLSHAFDAIALKKFKLYYENLKGEYDVSCGDKKLGQGRLRKLINAAHSVGASKLSKILLISFLPQEILELYFPEFDKLEPMVSKIGKFDNYGGEEVKDCVVSSDGSIIITHNMYDNFHFYCNNKHKFTDISEGRPIQGDMINQDASRMVYRFGRYGDVPQIFDLNTRKKVDTSYIESIKGWKGIGKLSPKGFTFADIAKEDSKTLNLMIIDTNGQLIHKLPIPIPGVYTDTLMANVLTWSPDEKYIVIACRHKKYKKNAYLLFLYDCEKRTITEIFKQPASGDSWDYAFESVTFTPNGEKIVAVTIECIYILDSKTHAIEYEIKNTQIFPDEKTDFSEGDVTFSSDGIMCFLAQVQRIKKEFFDNKNYNIVQINVHNGSAHLQSLENRKIAPWQSKAIFTPNGLFLIVLDNKNLSFYRTRTGKEVLSFTAQSTYNQGTTRYDTFSINKTGDKLLLANKCQNCIYRLSILNRLNSYENKLAPYKR